MMIMMMVKNMYEFACARKKILANLVQKHCQSSKDANLDITTHITYLDILFAAEVGGIFWRDATWMLHYAKATKNRPITQQKHIYWYNINMFT